MKLLKFGGKSLANGEGLANVVSIIEEKVNAKEQIVVVVSARGETTDLLETFLEKSKKGQDIFAEWQAFKTYQIAPLASIDYSKEFALLEQIYQGVRLVEDYSLKVKDLVMAQGELLASKMVAELLQRLGIESFAVDSRQFLKTDNRFGDTIVLEEISEPSTVAFFTDIPSNVVPIVTGYIASNKAGETTTLGRNGSNYTASLLAKYLNVEELESYTHLDGIYTANPEQVPDAKIIKNLNYQEAGELAEFGASILHAKTIVPLIEKDIPLRILNTFNRESRGTLISTQNEVKGVKAITIQENACIISMDGKGLLGSMGTDARIFGVMGEHKISVGVISQGSSERGIDFIINEEKAELAVEALKEEFRPEFITKDVSSIKAIKDIVVVTIIGQGLEEFTKSFDALAKNGIRIILINNTLNGKNISVVLAKKDAYKAINVIHGHIFGVATNINVAIFGKGTVGGSLIDQIMKSKQNIQAKRDININIFAIAGTDKVLLDYKGIGADWREKIAKEQICENVISKTISYAESNHLENLIAIDNTASDVFIQNYIPLVENGYDLISSNKKANTNSYADYKLLREKLKKYVKQYLYETNVGAGLPLIDTIRLLHDSGENITRIRGVFSGSLSFLFNHFSVEDKPFSEILQEAIANKYTEPDPREDLCGNDVARKLLILARELDLENEFDDIQIENLIPEQLREVSVEDFFTRLEEMNPVYEALKKEQEKDFVLRYVGDLSGDLNQTKGNLSVTLASVPKNSVLGQLKGSDSLFEIYTESYGENPIVIQGAGAGAAVTARGVFGDLLRIADKK